MCKFYFSCFLLTLFVIFSVNAQNIAINEVVGSNQTLIADEDGDYNDWIELYNFGQVAVNLEGYGLSDNTSNPFKWIFPNITMEPNSFLLIWASGKNRIVPTAPLHTNFSISSSGEPIVLTTPSQHTVDLAPSVPFQMDVSYGRQPDGTGNWFYFYTPTPNAPNIGLGLSELVLPPNFSHHSGLYQNNFQLTLSHPNPNATIIYTLDGSDPDIGNLGGSAYNFKNEYPLAVGSPFGPLLTASYTSLQYANPLLIVDRSSFPDQTTIKNTSQSQIHIPPQPVRKGTVVKARAYISGVGSPIISRTFFVWPQGNPYEHPVISIITAEKHLFDYEDGIYTAGIDFDTWRTNNPNNNQHWRPEWNNYWRSGPQWEYPMNVEIFEPVNFTSLINQRAGFRIHGNNSRALPIKNLRWYARGRYDNNSLFELPIFESEIPDAPIPGNVTSKRVMMRGNGSGGPIYYDVAFNRLMQPVFNGVTRIRHAIHFVNGEFWGLTAIRDRFDRHHYVHNFGLTEDNIIQVDCKGSNCSIDEGVSSDFSSFTQMRNFIINNNMADQALFQQAEALLEMSSFIDHMVLQIFSADDSYERFFWRVRTPENENYGDGRWRVSTQDFEAALKSNTNWLVHWSNTGLSSNSAMFANLLANDGFRNQFINRFADLLNSAFLPSRFTSIINDIYDEINPYLDEDANRMPKLSFFRASERTNLLNWANNRPAFERENIRTHFNIESTLNVSLNVSDTQAGQVKINSILIDSATPGLAANPYPWSGIYYKNIPITLTAIPKPGYVFSHWSGASNSTDATITINPQENLSLTANFTEEEFPYNTAYFWLLGTQIPNDTPMLNISSTFAINQTTATLAFESCLEGYPFTNTHPQWRKASMERRNLPTDINYRPDANNFVPFADANVRGIQIRQPFQNGNLQNTLKLQFSTLNMTEIKVGMASQTDGAAEQLIFDYWNGQTWTNSGLSQSSFPISADYQYIELDFSDIALANNQPNFQVRIRFGGPNMTEDTGKRVHFNNISVDGNYTMSNDTWTQAPSLRYYPNPAQDVLYIASDRTIDHITVGNMMGQTLMQINAQDNQTRLDIQSLPTGMYLVNVKWGEQTQSFKFLKK